jgi:hypothetical protein
MGKSPLSVSPRVTSCIHISTSHPLPIFLLKFHNLHILTMAGTSGDVTELQNAIKEEYGSTTKIPGWDSLSWTPVSQTSNPIFVLEKLMVGTFANNRKAYAYYASSSNNQARATCIFRDRNDDLSSEIPKSLYGNIDLVEPFQSIEASHLKDTERRNILRTVLRACFILRGHPKNYPGEMSTSFKEYFRRGLTIITKAQVAVMPSKTEEVAPVDRQESTPAGGITSCDVDTITVSFQASLVAMTQLKSQRSSARTRPPPTTKLCTQNPILRRPHHHRSALPHP